MKKISYKIWTVRVCVRVRVRVRVCVRDGETVVLKQGGRGRERKK